MPDASSPKGDDKGKAPTNMSTHFPIGVKWVINPRNEYMKRWDLIMLSLLLYTALVTPYEVAFLETSVNVLFVINKLVDLLFLKDMVMNFFLASLDLEEGYWVVQHKQIALRYIRSWFIIDFTSILPFDTVGVITGDTDIQNLQILRVVRLFRLLKLFRIFRASRIFARWEAYISVSYSWLALIKFMVLVLTVSHWLACFFRLVIDIEVATKDDGEPVNWITEYDYVTKETPHFILYLTSLYWSVMTLTTIGYGDVIPVTPAERFVALIAMMLGGSVYAYIIGAVCGIVASMDEATTAYRKNMDDLNLYMEEYKIPQELRRRLREYFNQCRPLQRARHYRDLLTKMSPMLRGEVAMAVNRDWVDDLPFLVGVPDDEKEMFTTEIALHLEIEAFAPNETVVKPGQSANKMYIIQRGVVSMLGRVYRSGDILGDDMILHDANRPYAVRSLTFVAMSTLAKEDFEDILHSGVFPRTVAIVRKSAIRMSLRREFIHYANSILALQAVIPSFNGKSAKDLRRVLAEGGSKLTMPPGKDISPLLMKPRVEEDGSKLGTATDDDSPRMPNPLAGSGRLDGSKGLDAASPHMASHSSLILGRGASRRSMGARDDLGDGDGAGGPPGKHIESAVVMDSALKRVIADAERELGLPEMSDAPDADLDTPLLPTAVTEPARRTNGLGGLGGSFGGGSGRGVGGGDGAMADLGRSPVAGFSPATGAGGGNLGLGPTGRIPSRADVDVNGEFAKLQAKRHNSMEANLNAMRQMMAARLEEVFVRVQHLETAVNSKNEELDDLAKSAQINTLTLMAVLNIILVIVVLARQ